MPASHEAMMTSTTSTAIEVSGDKSSSWESNEDYSGDSKGGKNGKQQNKKAAKQFKKDVKGLLKALEKGLDAKKGEQDEAEAEILMSLLEFTVDAEQGIKVKHLLVDEELPEPEMTPAEEAVHLNGIFDC